MATAITLREFGADDAELIRREVLSAGQPCVLKGLVRDWPAVAAGRRSPQELVKYLGRFDSGTPVDAIMTPPEVRGRIFYNPDMSGFNFLRNRLPLTQREAEVLLWIARGKSNRDIAEILSLSPRTVNKHLEQIFNKIGVENRASAAALAVRMLGAR